MTRTQVSLEEVEYLFLKRQAERDKQSLAAVVRHLIRKEMESQSAAVVHVVDVAGLVEAGPSCGYH